MPAGAAVKPGAIVACEEYNRLFVNVVFFQMLDDFPHTPVNLLDGVSMGAAFGFAFEVFRRNTGLMRIFMGKIQKKRFVFGFFNKIDAFLGE